MKEATGGAVDARGQCRAFFIGFESDARLRAAGRRAWKGYEETTVVTGCGRGGCFKRRPGFSAGCETRMLVSMSLSRTFAPPPALGVASFYAFFFYAVTSPADRMRA